MQKSLTLFAALFVSSAALATPAFAAASGSTSHGAQMQAGPGQNFPDVMRLAPNLKVTIHGCVQSAWCDVEWRGNRGWVSAAALNYRMDGTLLPVSGYDPRAGIPQIDFNLPKYWETHYRQRPWYPERQQWTSRIVTPASLTSND